MAKQKLSNERIVVEKETLMAFAIGIISTGMTMLQAGQKVGVAFVMVGLSILWIRGKFKYNRWETK